MKRSKSFDGKKPTLYLIATPIGNLKEMSPRALEIISDMDIIAAEDTRNAFSLLANFNLKKELFSLREHNEIEARTVNGLIMILASVVLLVFSISSGITRTEGFVLFACLILFTVISIKNGRTKHQDDDSQNETNGKKPMKLIAALLLVAISCVMLSFGADLLVDGASSMAKALGVSDKVIGLTIVALGTSLPELAASVAAAIKKEMDISIGNIIGSNIFNILCVLGVSASIRPILFDFAQYSADFIIMILFAVALLLFISPWKSSGRLGRTAGILLFAAYAIYASILFK